MTLTSLRQLAWFVNKYKPEGRIADYGGTDTIGAPIVERMLSMRKVKVIGNDADPFDIKLEGSLNKNESKYFTLDFDNGVDLRKPIKGKKFDYGICMDLLEHTSNPFVVAKNIYDSLQKGALLFVTVPWIWEIHYYPKDYWRFAPQGLEELFPKMKKLSLEIVRDQSPEEEVPRSRLVAVFKKI